MFLKIVNIEIILEVYNYIRSNFNIVKFLLKLYFSIYNFNKKYILTYLYVTY